MDTVGKQDQKQPGVRVHGDAGSGVAGMPEGPIRATEASNGEQDSFSFPAFLVREFGGNGVWMTRDPGEKEIRNLEQQASGASAAVVGTYQGHLHQGQLEVVRRIAALGIPTVCVAMRNPYDVDQLPDSVGKICAYEYSEGSIREVAARLSSR